MALPVGKIAAGALVIVVSFAGAFLVMKLMSPGGSTRRPALVEVPTLRPLARSSVIVTPTTIALTAIRDVMEQAAPKNLTGKRADPAPQLLTGAEIGWDITRGPLTVSGGSDALTVSTPLNGTLRATGEFSDRAGDLSGLIGNLLNQNFGQNDRRGRDNKLDQRANIRGSITMTSRPQILPSWRIEPNLTAEVSLADASMSLMGFRLNLAQDIKPLLDRNVSEQVSELQAKVSKDPFLETIARQEWTKMCRSLPLGQAANGMPDLWLEIRPVRAFAAQPRTDQATITLTMGVEAETRIIPAETKPSCPFPAQLEIVPQLQQGRVNLAVPIDMPFTEINRLLETQLEGKSFPEDGRGALTVKVRDVSVAASGDRLLISLRVKANETKSWFGFGTEATVYVWGRPVLDNARQTLRLADIALDVESQAAFGILGAAARATMPYLERAVAESAVVDLRPLVQNARRSIETALADFRQAGDGVRVDAAVTGLRLVGVAFDAKTLRVIAEADGTVNVAVTALQLQ